MVDDSAACPGHAPEAAMLRRMGPPDIDAVLAVERSANAFAWTRGHFADALADGYPCLVLEGPAGEILAYIVLMAGVDELHLLNIATAADHRRRGHARRLVAAAADLCRGQGWGRIWLEVREGNRVARQLYRSLGFVEDGRRPRYYPAAGGREDAVLMSLAVPCGQAGQEQAAHALD